MKRRRAQLSELAVIHNKKNKSKIQTVLSFASSAQSETCKECGMTFFKHIQKDRAVHITYHGDFMNGLPWEKSDKDSVSAQFTVKEASNKGSYITLTAQIFSVSHGSASVGRVEQILAMVNRELSAPEASGLWKLATETAVQGRAFVVVVANRAVGLCVTEPILDSASQSRWMVFETQQTVPNQVNKQIKLGVSRIWVAPKWRRTGLARRLLEAVQRNTVYGITLGRGEIAFSQPSFAGGLLAKSFNGVKHKSGKILVPVYIED